VRGRAPRLLDASRVAAANGAGARVAQAGPQDFIHDIARKTEGEDGERDWGISYLDNMPGVDICCLIKSRTLLQQEMSHQQASKESEHRAPG